MRFLSTVGFVFLMGGCNPGLGQAGDAPPPVEEVSVTLDPPLPGVSNGAPSLPKEYREAFLTQGKDYKPRAHHRDSNGKPQFTNRLIFETSPYLLQHAHNPVNWYGWGEDPFGRAEKEGKLLLLSVGYSTCHWCHVMERESFEDLEIAGYLNANYISIKVDREERPDVDSIYMTAVGILAGRGGWPMTVILTPDKLPVFAGTYFPPRDGARGSRRGFLTILKSYRELYLSDPSGLVATAQTTAAKLLQGVESNRQGQVPSPGTISRAVEMLKGSYDPVDGGFGRAPKFPRSVNIELILRYYHRSKDKAALEVALGTLRKMANGGMYDQVGGGFHRYATDRRWRIPHFEKMLYDNGQLVAAYLEAYQVTGDEFFSRVATEVLDYVALEMTHPQGPFYSATDADSPTGKGHDEEGLFFTWTIPEVEGLLKAGSMESRLIKQYYNMTPRGNFEGRNILHVTRSFEEVARELKLTLPQAKAVLKKAKQVLYDARLKRLPPILDDKILVAWNGLMISAFARGAFVLGRDAYAGQAVRAAEFLLKEVRDGERLRRSYRQGRSRHDATLDDYSFLIQGLLDLYEATAEVRWLDEAIGLQKILDREFWDKEKGGYFFISENTPVVLAREKPSYDGAEPSGNSVTALNLLRLEHITGQAAYRNQVVKLFQGFSQSMTGYTRSVPKMLTALDYFHDEAIQVIVVKPDQKKEDPLQPVLASTYLPNHVFMVVTESDVTKLAGRLPVLMNKKAKGARPTAYVCRGPVCSAPIVEPAALVKELAKVTPYRVRVAGP